MTDAADHAATTDPLSRADRDAIFHPTLASWPVRASLTLAVIGLGLLFGTEHVWRPMLAEWGW